jgi:hypothetical protein
MFAALKRWWFRRKVRNAAYILRQMDSYMAGAGYKRAERRQFWRDFISNQAVRDSTLDELDQGTK